MSKVERTPSRKKLDEKKKSEKEKKNLLNTYWKVFMKTSKFPNLIINHIPLNIFENHRKYRKNVKIRMILSIFRKVFSEEVFSNIEKR